MKLPRLVCGIVTIMALAIIVPGFSANLFAANIVVNGGFESGDFTGWTQNGNTGFTGVQCPGPSSAVTEGNCSAFFGPIGSTGGISQILSTVAGQSYQITFDFMPDGGTPGSFSATFDGDTLVDLTDPASSPYQEFSFLRTATSASTTLEFNFRNDPGFMLLDAVNVNTDVPEPTSLLLLGSSLGGIALAFGKRAKNKI